jgi:hypothetical protein
VHRHAGDAARSRCRSRSDRTFEAKRENAQARNCTALAAIVMRQNLRLPKKDIIFILSACRSLLSVAKASKRLRIRLVSDLSTKEN